MPSFRAVLHACSAAALVAAAACADSTSPRVQPTPREPAASLRLVCNVSVAKRTVACAAPGAAEGVRADRILGQGAGIKLTSSNIAIVADSFTFDMTVTNQLEYPVGTTDGVNADPNGIRVFFVDGIHTTAGTGSVTVDNADGVGTFTASGQAYFAYPGVLQPAATTAPRRWKLRFDPGVETFSFGLYVSTPVPPGGGTVALTILEPIADSTFADSVVVRARIDSAPAAMQSVRAFALDSSVLLTPYAPGLVRGTLRLGGLPFGPLQVRVHAVTVRADTGNAFVTIRKDAPPTLVLAGPREDYVAHPSLRIDVDCVDDNPSGCASITAGVGGTTIAFGTTGIHTDVGLGNWGTQRVPIIITAMDSRGQKIVTTKHVYVEDNEHGALVFADSAGVLAMDLDSTRLFFADSANAVWLADRTSHARTLVQSGTAGGAYGFLYPGGALFGRSIDQHLYELRNGTVQEISSSASGVVVEGSWAAWADGPGIVRRNLATGASEAVGNGIQPDVASNGDLVWSDGTGVYRYRTGVGTTLVDSSGTGPVTDGINVVYLKAGTVMRWDGAIRTVLSTPPAGAGPHTHYETSGGWIAYPVVTGGGSGIRLRAPDGSDYEATLGLSGNSQVRGLSPEGTLMVANAGQLRVHRAFEYATFTRLGRDWFRVRFRGTQPQLFLGNTVFGATY